MVWVLAQAEMSDDGGHSDDGEDDDADADGMLVRTQRSSSLLCSQNLCMTLQQ